MIHLIKTSARLLKQQQSLTLVAPSPYSPPFHPPAVSTLPFSLLPPFNVNPESLNAKTTLPFSPFLSSSSLFNFRTFRDHSFGYQHHDLFL